MKVLGEFYRDSSKKDGLRNECKSCKKVKAAAYYDDNRESQVEYLKKWREHNPNHHFKGRYGMTMDRFVEMMASQGGKCAICRQVPEAGKRLHVDHDHGTGLVRSLLCKGCNTLLGFAREDPAVLSSAIEYLRRFSTHQSIA
jgi:hypothetical protein